MGFLFATSHPDSYWNYNIPQKCYTLQHVMQETYDLIHLKQCLVPAPGLERITSVTFTCTIISRQGTPPVRGLKEKALCDVLEDTFAISAF